MSNKDWKIEYASKVPVCLVGKIVCYEDAGPIKGKCHIIFKAGIISLYFGYDFYCKCSLLVQKECLVELTSEITNIISWKYNIPIGKPRVGTGVLDHTCKCVVSDKDYVNVFAGAYTEKTKQIFDAYRDMKDERNDTLRFLICYRFLEVLSKSNNKGVKSLIDELFPSTLRVKNNRNNEKINIISYMRGKIHATNNKYKFPYKSLSNFVDLAEGLLRKAITREIV